ncbi:MAG: sn-glycerol-3-phosphate ABC transporter ATP-binding protein UgpC [Candidatus Hydrogenedentota bacterium]|nr:MAG: sn-glycerol-3-phosphate ABC transporter ATP-binding protein UgpC [Candidatus Hydrogenedentota bacterium]
MADVVLKNIRKVYPGGVVAVKDINIEIKDQEFVVLVGPSGCGKTTTLRMVAGLEEISSGDLLIDGERMNDVPPKNRNIAMVFQNYALYPHLTVRENMAFGLKLRGVPKVEIERRVKEVAAILGLESYLDRQPSALSGGQRQRVALGRAIVRKPKVFLFDEPLSNLDAKLRVQTRAELSKLHQKLRATVLYVTHDQVEAMTMGTRIIVMKDGVVQQNASPIETYDHPANIFVAGFIGSPPMNFLEVEIKREGDELYLVGSGFSLRATQNQRQALERTGVSEVVLGIRPEHFHDKLMVPDAPDDQTVTAVVDVVEPMGHETYLYLTLGGQTVTARVDPHCRARVGQDMDLVVEMKQTHVFDKRTERAIT